MYTRKRQDLTAFSPTNERIHRPAVRRMRGFTIVELLVVIVVIAILASITIVAYSGIRERAINTAHLSEIMAWRDSFVLYQATTGSYPSSMTIDTEYCLGTGFPDGTGGVPRCHNYNATDSYAVAESGNAALMAQLTNEVDIPSTGDRTPIQGIVGPYALLTSYDGITLFVQLFMTWYGSDCPAGTDSFWTSSDGRVSTCAINITG